MWIAHALTPIPNPKGHMASIELGYFFLTSKEIQKLSRFSGFLHKVGLFFNKVSVCDSGCMIATHIPITVLQYNRKMFEALMAL